MDEVNLARLDGVRIAVSVPNSSGGGAETPAVLLNDTAHLLDGHPLQDFSESRTYDTCAGRHKPDRPDWYAIAFPYPVTFNCLEMTMAFPHPSGGWWTSLTVEVRDDAGADWSPVQGLTCTPPYRFADTHEGRRPFETHVLTFEPVTARAVRISGRPGGPERFTSLARLAVYRRDLSRWNPATVPAPAVPYVFKLIPAHLIWDLSQHMTDLAGLRIRFPLLAYYLDRERQRRFREQIARNYAREPELWFLIGEAEGWRVERDETGPVCDGSRFVSRDPYVHTHFHQTLARAVAPIVVAGQILGEMYTYDAVLKGPIDWPWHRRYAAAHAIPWDIYRAAVRRSTRMTTRQLEGAAGLMGLLANAIANRAYRLEREQAPDLSAQKRQLVRTAIAYMEEHLDLPVSVADVAREIGVSASYLCRLFAEQLGRTPRDFLINLRIERGKEYLIHTNMSVTEVCVALGYDVSYFAKLFRRHTGLTPVEYARHHRAL